jgi:hypothetical protein
MIEKLSRRKVLASALGGFAVAAVSGTTLRSLAQGSATTPLDVYKDPSCGCCANWIDQMTERNFQSTIHHPRNLNAVKLEHGFVPQLQSCHTAVTAEGYAFEGHVPPKLVSQFLQSPPANAKGLTVPGMPMGSPGMEMGGRFQPYDVIQLNRDGSTSVYAQIRNAADQY